MVLLEMKGAEFDQDHAKYQAARRWVSAVNNWGRLGKWDFVVCRDPLGLAKKLLDLA
jgi:type III restriction enzyme